VGEPILRAIEERLSQEQSLGHAIEFGCGTGYFTKAMASNATHIVATDLSDEMLEVARTELRDLANVTIRKADCNHTSFSAQSFDSVFMANLLHVIDDPAQCLRESQRILRDGGRLIVVDFTGYRLRFGQKIKLGFRYVRTWGRPPRHGQNSMTPDELVNLVENAGFSVEEIELLRAGMNALYLRARKRKR
jgi:ABC-2 type transport system ATP-binding protein